MEYRFDFFSKPWVRRWHIVGLRTDVDVKGSRVIGRINYGRLVGANLGEVAGGNLQYQVEAYPRLGPSDYAYLALAYSGSKLFPGQQYGAEWFHSFDKGFEASLGLHYLRWKDPFWFYTGSVGKYLGNYWFSLRTYISSAEKLTGQTYTFSARRYLATGDDYLGLMLEYGTSPEDLSYLIDFPEIKRLRSLGARVSYQRLLNNWLFKAELGYRNEEYRADLTRDHLNTRLHLLYHF